MSLDFNVENVKDYEKTCWTEEGEVVPLLEAMIFITMTVDLPGVNDKNIYEWIWRMEFLHKLGRDVVNRSIKRKKGVFTREELERYSGFTTNVATLPRTKWVNKIMKGIKSDAMWAADTYLREEKEGTQYEEGIPA